MYEHVWFAERVLTLGAHWAMVTALVLDDLPGAAASTDGGMDSVLNRFDFLDALDSLSPACAAEQTSLRRVRSLRGLDT
jgi:hypothetical protein